MEGNLYFILKLLPVLAITAAAFGYFGWWLRCKVGKCGATRDELGRAQARVTELEAALGKALAAPPETKGKPKARGSQAKEKAIDPKEFEELKRQLEGAKAEAESQRVQAQKAREALDAANARAKDALKAPQQRIFALESEISKAREEAARARAGLSEAGPDTETMANELAKLKQSLAAATAGYGKLQRERDALAAEIDKMKGYAPSQTKRDLASQSGPAGPNPEAARQKVLGMQKSRTGAAMPTKLIATTPAPQPAKEPILVKAAVPADADVGEAPGKSPTVSDPLTAADEVTAVVPHPGSRAQEVSPDMLAAAESEAPAVEPSAAAEDLVAVGEEVGAEIPAAGEGLATEEVALEVTVPVMPNALLGSGLLPGLGEEGVLASGMKNLEASDVMGKRVLQDDLKLVEGIGPKIEELFKAAGLETWEAVAAATPERLKEILKEGGDRFTLHDPTTWPQQAGLMAAGKWDEVKKLQDELEGGR